MFGPGGMEHAGSLPLCGHGWNNRRSRGGGSGMDLEAVSGIDIRSRCDYIVII